MAVFASTAKIDGKPLTDIIGTPALTNEQWAQMKQDVIKGGAKIIELRGRSSFQSPSFVSIEAVPERNDGYAFNHRRYRRSLH